MRSRIVRVAVTALLVALVLFAVPLAVVARVALVYEERLELERVALEAGVRVGPDFARGDPVELPVDSTHTVGVYDTSLRLQNGRGPAVGDDAVRRAEAGTVADAQEDRFLVVAVPISSGETVVGVVRAAVPTMGTWSHVLFTWLGLAVLACAATGLAVLVARRQARILSEPLESLADTSRQIADGDLIHRVPPSSIPEIQRLAETQNSMLDHLTERLHREHVFSTDVSHQLRTPLAGLQLIVEHALTELDRPRFDARAAFTDISAQIDQLHQTIDDLLRATRSGPSSWLAGHPQPLTKVLAQAERLWHGPLAAAGRRLTVPLAPDIDGLAVPGRAVTEILNVLLDNALRHGRGAVTIDTRTAGDAVVVDVQDEGTLTADPETLFDRRGPDPTGHGIGLPLARSIAEACGGRLRLTSATPTRWSVIVPSQAEERLEKEMANRARGSSCRG